MYDKIGKKIQVLAILIFIFGSIIGVIAGIVYMFVSNSMLLGFVIFIASIPGSLIPSWLLYGFGEIIEKLRIIEYNTRENKTPETNTQIERTKRSTIEIGRKKNTESVFSKSSSSGSSSERKICPYCGDTVKSSVCEMCGNTNNLFD